MSTTGGGIPPHDIEITHRPSGISIVVAESDVEAWCASLPDGVLKQVVEKFLADIAKTKP